MFFLVKAKKLARSEGGATAIEYALLAIALGMMLVVAMPHLASGISEIFYSLGSSLSTAANKG